MKKRIILFIGFIALCIFTGMFGGRAEAAEQEFVKTFKVTSKKYGAKKGTDSTEAIQKALNAARKAGTSKMQARVLIPKGTYYIHDELIIGSNTYLELAEGAVIKKSPEVSETTFYMLHTRVGKKGKYADNSNITVTGGTWDGEFKHHIWNSGASIFVFAHCKNLEIKNVTVCNNFGTHLIELDGVKDCTISDCDFYGFKAAKSDTEKEAIQLDICHNDAIAPGAMPFDDTACVGITLINNEIHDYPRAFGSHTMVEEIYHKDIKVINNNIHDLKGAAIYGYNYANVTITGNTINNVRCGIQLKSYSEKAKSNILARLPKVKAMKLEEDAYNIVIKDNDIITNNLPVNDVGSDGGPMGIFIYGATIYPINVVEIEHNRLITDSSGVYLRHVNQAIISNNSMDRHDNGYDVEKSTFSEDAIKLAACTEVKILENRISSMSDSSYENGIAMRDGSKDIYSNMNELYNMTKSGIAIYGGCEYIGENENLNSLGKHGVTLDGAKATITNFVISNCGENGVTLKNCSVISMDGCSVSANGKKGISVMSKADEKVIEEIDEYDDDDEEYVIEESSDEEEITQSVAVLNNVAVYNNGDTGIYATNSSLELYNCQIQNNIGKGIVVKDSNLVMQNSSVINNSSNGLKSDSSMIDASYNKFVNNCFDEMDGKAIFMMAGSSGVFTDNTIYNQNAKYEVFVAVGVRFRPLLESQKAETIRGRKDSAGNLYDI